MHRSPLFACLATAVLFILSHHGRATEIPFTFRDGLVWLKVQVPGQRAPLNFLLDSGASATVVDLETARRLGMKSAHQIAVNGVHTRSLAYEWNGFAGHVADLALPKEVLALDLRGVSRGCHQRIDGLVGADFFHGRIVQVDYGASTLRIFPRRAAPPSPGLVVPIAMRNDAMCVRVQVGADAGKWTRLDTGCDSALHWVQGSDRELKNRGASIAATANSRHHLTTDVRLGAEVLRGVPTTLHSRPIFSGEAGLVGNGLLSHFTVTFDRDGHRLWLARR